MGAFKTGTRTKNGILGYYNLLDWWQQGFTNQEKIYILQKYRTLGGSELTKGVMVSSSLTEINFLTGLHSWFTTLLDEAIAEKILKKAENLINDETPILDIHFLYGCFIEHYYKKRKIDITFYELAKVYCLKQIAMSHKTKIAFLSVEDFSELPGHKGYEQLAIILEKEKLFNDALKLCFEAKEAGWNTVWDKRILKLQEKIKD